MIMNIYIYMQREREINVERWAQPLGDSNFQRALVVVVVVEVVVSVVVVVVVVV